MNLINNSNNSGANNNNANNTNNNWIIGASLLMVFIVGVLVGAGVFFFLQNQNNKNIISNKGASQLRELDKIKPKLKENSLLGDLSNNPDNTINKEISESKNRTLSSDEQKILSDKLDKMTLPIIQKNINISKGDVQWEEARDIGNIGLTTEKMYRGCVSYYNGNPNHNTTLENICPKDMIYASSQGVKYVRVGLINRGKFKGYEIILVKSGYIDGPGKDLWITMLKKDKHTIFLLESTQNNENKWLARILGGYFNNGDYKVEAISGVKFEELEMPEIIKDNKTGARFSINKYDQAFFDKTNLQVAFQHPIYGTVWMSRSINPIKSKSELNSYKEYDNKDKKFIKKYVDIFDDNGFYIKLPNGMVASYKLVLDDISDTQERFGVIKATWNDGVVNDVEYELNPSGCGSTSHVYNITGRLNIDADLIAIGKTTSGKILYGFKDTSTKEFKRLYNDIYYAKDGKKSEDEFLSTRPQVFYVDPYNRLITFYRADILSPAECGKPVIYLYPEKPMDVNVQVEPNEGISVSEPKYSIGGWNVFARPSGELTFAGQKYPYLFWEGSSDVSYQQSERGWVIAKKNLNQFFDDKLKKLGLIQKEVDDFKEFWLPEMTKHNKPYYFITFLPQRKINQLAPLTITPKPDTIIRIMMDYRELDKYEEVVGFNIKTPRREGFTAVEWGGMLK